MTAIQNWKQSSKPQFMWICKFIAYYKSCISHYPGNTLEFYYYHLKLSCMVLPIGKGIIIAIALQLSAIEWSQTFVLSSIVYSFLIWQGYTILSITCSITPFISGGLQQICSLSLITWLSHTFFLSMQETTSGVANEETRNSNWMLILSSIPDW